MKFKGNICKRDTKR